MHRLALALRPPEIPFSVSYPSRASKSLFRPSLRINPCRGQPQLRSFAIFRDFEPPVPPTPPPGPPEPEEGDTPPPPPPGPRQGDLVDGKPLYGPMTQAQQEAFFREHGPGWIDRSVRGASLIERRTIDSPTMDWEFTEDPVNALPSKPISKVPYRENTMMEHYSSWVGSYLLRFEVARRVKLFAMRMVGPKYFTRFKWAEEFPASRMVDMIAVGPLRRLRLSWASVFPSFHLLESVRKPAMHLSFIAGNNVPLIHVPYIGEIKSDGLQPELTFRWQWGLLYADPRDERTMEPTEAPKTVPAQVATEPTDAYIPVPDLIKNTPPSAVPPAPMDVRADPDPIYKLPTELPVYGGYDFSLGFIHFGWMRVGGLPRTQRMLYAGLNFPLPGLGISKILTGTFARDPDGEPLGLPAQELRKSLREQLVDEAWPLNSLMMDESRKADFRNPTAYEKLLFEDMERQMSEREKSAQAAAELAQQELDKQNELLLRQVRGDPPTASPSSTDAPARS